MASFNPMIPNVALAVQPESVPLAKEPSQLMRFKNIHSMVTNEMARKSRHLSEVYTGVSVFPSSSTASSSSNSINGNASGNGNAELLEGLPSPPPPSPCLSPSSVHSLMETDSSLPTNHVMDCMSMPITPRTPMITNDDDVDNDNDDNGGLSQMTKELLSFWEEIEPATNTSDTLKLDYRLSLLLNNSRKDIHTSGGTAAAAAASILAMDNTMTNIWDDNHSNSNHEQEEEEEEELPRESESATDSNKLLDAFLAPDQDWFRNVNASRLALDGARPQSVLALTSHREHRYSDDVTTDLWSSTAPPPLVPITTTTSANAITPRRRASQVSSIRPITSYELTMPFNLKSPTILVTPNATTKLSTPPTSEKIKKSPSASSRFITWNAKSLIRKTKAEPRHTAPNSPNYTDILEESTDNKATDDMSKPPMLRGRSRSVSTTREMASMVSANRGQHHERAINKISEMFTSRKDTAAAAAAAAIAESSRLKPTNNNDSPVDVFSDGNGIIFKKKSMIKRIFTGRKHRQHPEGVSQHNNTNNNDSYCLRDRSESIPGGFTEKLQSSMDPLTEINDYERNMQSNSKQGSRANKARWSVQGSGLNLHDYQHVMLPSEAAQLRKDYIARKVRESNATMPSMPEHSPLSPTAESVRSSTEELATEHVTLFHTSAINTHDIEWFEDDELEQLEMDRRKAVFSLIRCEQKHLRGLVLLKGAFADPLRTAAVDAEAAGTPIFDTDKLDIIFGCAIKMIQFHKMFLRDLDRSIKEHAQTGTLESAFTAFSSHMPGFRFYLHYMKRYPEMMSTFDELYANNLHFRRTLEECAEQVEHINVRALLGNPLEHIAHYHTFLQKILELYSFEDPEYQGFMQCIKQIRQIKSESTKLARAVRQAEEVKQVQASLKGLTFPLVTPTRQLIYQGSLSQQIILTGKSKQRVCFLFNDMLVFAKEKDNGQLHYKGHIDLEMASVLELPTDQMENAFVIMDKVDRSFYFQAETPIFWSQWIYNLNETLGNPQVITAAGSNSANLKAGRSPVTPDSEFTFF